MNIKVAVTAFFAVFLLSAGGLVFAQSDEEIATVTPNVIDQSVFKVQEDIVISDVINGDLYCLGNKISIVGIVEGDVICAANQVEITGTINGDLRIAASTIRLDGDVSGSVTSLSKDFNLEKDGTIGLDAVLIGSNIAINGSIGRDLVTRGGQVVINGQIERNVKAYYSDLDVTGNSSIGGSFEALGTNRSNYNFNMSDSGILSPESFLSWLLASSVILIPVLYIAFFLSLMFSALAISTLFPKSLQDSANFGKNQPGITFIAGLLTTTLAPLVILLLAISVVGLPIALILWLLNGVVVLLSFPFVAHTLGSLIYPTRSHPIKSLAGSVLLLIAFAIPVLNILTLLFVIIMGSGLVVRLALQRYNEANDRYRAKQSV
jgi:cytoskeletal protein CcmA (bactofilin family)